ncbi:MULTISPECIES: ParB N-terminal domain-containing protein [unclassified Spirosoma]|uniref:ParB N-terminal domain-containing protein n=1 Tax=unclassified Spirosoma TaxID=2621999 RepID=UPI0009616764|nr:MULTISPECIES: ParB N-terminal domain-containing protein [unclassified Spirosoma]MBN8824463.1 ParB N-terminal domain-containing protein [Spirosoma sp.]OJW70073.1 MAG: hypothetical protein BGO59_25705 [Spirosoma sp. 48-14]
MNLVISPTLDKLPTINSNELEDLQGNFKDLSKSNYTKLKHSLETEGFLFPLFVWKEPVYGVMYSFDGHQRLRVIQREIPGGIELPYILVHAETRDEAKRKLLLFNSQYGEVTKDGWDEFIADMGDAVDYVNELTTFGGFLDENWTPPGNDVTDETKDAGSAGSDGSAGAGDVTYRIEAICVSEREQEELYNELTDRGFTCKVLTL